jgi:hypothetical protein
MALPMILGDRVQLQQVIINPGDEVALEPCNRYPIGRANW